MMVSKRTTAQGMCSSTEVKNSPTQTLKRQKEKISGGGDKQQPLLTIKVHLLAIIITSVISVRSKHIFW